MNSRSWILQEWQTPKTERVWGYYRVLHEQGKDVKVKELTVDPGKCLSMQRHKDRGEHWFVSEGTATVYDSRLGERFPIPKIDKCCSWLRMSTGPFGTPGPPPPWRPDRQSAVNESSVSPRKHRLPDEVCIAICGSDMEALSQDLHDMSDSWIKASAPPRVTV
jgi:hypothetical protein